VDGYSYTDHMEMEERVPIMTNSNRDLNESSDKHELKLPAVTEQSLPMVFF